VAIHRCRREVLQRLVRQIVIMQVDIMLHPLPCLTGTTVLVNINFIVLQTTPEALNDNVILGATFPVHADANLVLLEQINILRTCKNDSLDRCLQS
jgi:hypothetical protein